ncbi:hypothetical protein H2248_000175 [Termitomyces sp. 'cryptogamus']|nr:hypothetical protein H2248_000175 [Termitomyces sp. 'cryptogamus']
MGFTRNKTLFCGALTTVLAGYLFTQAFTDTAIARLRAEEIRLANSDPSSAGNVPFSSA